MSRVNVKSNIMKNLFIDSHFISNVCCSLNTTSKDKYNCELIRDCEYEFLIVPARNVTKGEELSMNYNRIFDHFKLKPFKRSAILNEINAMFL